MKLSFYMPKKKKLFYLNFILFLIYFSSIFTLVFASSSSKPSIKIVEKSELYRLLNGKYKLTVTGIVYVTNPSKYYIREFSDKIFLDSLIGLNIYNFKNNSIKFTYENNRIYTYMIPPNSTNAFSYQIYGIIDYNIYRKTKKSVLEYYSNYFNFYSDVLIDLEKPIRENRSNTNTSRRLITYGFKNPSGFTLLVNSLKLYRNNPNKLSFNASSPNEGILIDSKENFSLLPFQTRKVDFFDDYSFNNAIYWLVSDITIKRNNIVRNISRRLYFEKSLLLNNISKYLNFTINEGNESIINDNQIEKNVNQTFKSTNFLVKKSTDKVIVKPGETVTVKISIVNLNNYTVKGLEVQDFLPNNYRVINYSRSYDRSGDLITFSNINIGKYGEYDITYKLYNINKTRGITYLNPVKLLYNNYSYYSDGVLLINEMLPNKKVYIQKETYLKDLLISEYIDNNSIIKDISKPFYQKAGTWRINELSPNEEWTVSFLVNKNSSLISSLPNVYGVNKNEVFTNLIYRGEVVNMYNENSPFFEKIGLGFALGLLVLYLLF